MGTKRVGLARTQALIENLKRTLTMGGARFTNVKGVELVKHSALTTIPVAVGSTDMSITLPENAFVTDVGFINTAILGATSTPGTSFLKPAEFLSPKTRRLRNCLFWVLYGERFSK